MLRTIVQVDGFIGGPGINVIHWRGPGGALGGVDASVVRQFHDELSLLYDSLTTIMPIDCRYTILPDVTVFDPATGKATGVLQCPGDAITYQGQDTKGDLPRASAINLKLGTEDWKDGRRVQGRLFLGPIGGRALTTGGQISPTVAADIEDKCTSFTSGIGPWLQVWSRPKGALASDGTAHDVIGVRVVETPSTLRRRNR